MEIKADKINRGYWPGASNKFKVHFSSKQLPGISFCWHHHS